MQLKNIFPAMLLLLVVSFEIFCQNTIVPNKKGIITGVLIDSLSGKAIESASFLLFRLKDSTLAYGSISDKNGKFILKDIVYSDYFVKVSCVGYRTRKRNKIVLNSGSSNLNLDTIKLFPKSISTSEVKITAKRDRIVYNDDKIIVNVDKSAGVNAEEILENTPMVNLDIDGRISLMGRSGARIYIDGKPGEYSGISSADDLKMLHVSEIEKIELVPDASFEYLDNPQAGVINIITKKESSDKYSASSSLMSNTLKDILSYSNINYSNKNISIKGKYTNEYSGTDNEIFSQKTVFLNDTKNIIERNSRNQNKSNINFFLMGLNLNYEKNVLFIQTNYMNIFNDRKSSLLNNYLNNQNVMSRYFTNRDITNNRHKFFNATASYDRLFSQKGKSLNIFLAFSSNAMEVSDDISQDSHHFDPNMSDYSVMQKNTSNNTNRNITTSLAYSAVINKSTKFQIGCSSTYIQLSLNNNYTTYDPVQDEYVENYDNQLVQINKEMRNAINGSLAGQLWNTNYKMSLIVYNQYQESEEPILNNKFSRNFSKVIPHLSLSWKVWGNHSLSVSYQRFYNYPMNKQLNPHIDYSDSSNIVMGNSELEPFSLDSYSLRYTLPYGEEFINISGYYNINKNNIESITTQINSETAVTTYKNVASIMNYGVGISANKKLLTYLNVQPEISLSENKYESPYSNNKSLQCRGSLRLGLSFEFIKFQLNQNYSTKSLNAQDKAKAKYYANAMMKVMLFNKQLIMSLKVVDLFNTMHSDKEKFGVGFSSFERTKQTTRIFSLELSYFFQSLANDNMEDRPDNNMAEDDF